MAAFIAPPEMVRCAEMRYAVEASLSAEGDEGRTVDAFIKTFLQERQERLVPSCIDADDGTLGYRHVPFETIATVRIQYAPATQLMPRKFEFDDEDE